MMMRFFVWSVFAFFLMPMLVYAMDSVTEAPSRDVLMKKIEVLSSSFSPQDDQHFQTLYSNYVVAGTAKTVRGKIQNAVQECSSANADMVHNLDARFERWSKAVDPKLEEISGLVENMVVVQDYADEKAVRDILQYMERLRLYGIDRDDARVVTSREACGSFLDSMDETQAYMSGLLDSALGRRPQSRSPGSSKDVTQPSAD